MPGVVGGGPGAGSVPSIPSSSPCTSDSKSPPSPQVNDQCLSTVNWTSRAPGSMKTWLTDRPVTLVTPVTRPFTVVPACWPATTAPGRAGADQASRVTGGLVAGRGAPTSVTGPGHL